MTKKKKQKTDVSLKELRLGENAKPPKGQLYELKRGDFKLQSQIANRSGRSL